MRAARYLVYLSVAVNHCRIAVRRIQTHPDAASRRIHADASTSSAFRSAVARQMATSRRSARIVLAVARVEEDVVATTRRGPRASPAWSRVAHAATAEASPQAARDAKLGWCCAPHAACMAASAVLGSYRYLVPVPDDG